MRTLASTWPFEDQQNAFHFPSCGVSTCTLPTDATASPTPTDRSEKKAQRHRSSGSPSWSRWCAGPRPASGPTCDQRWGLKSEGPRSGNQQLKLVPNMLQPNIGPGRGVEPNSTQFKFNSIPYFKVGNGGSFPFIKMEEASMGHTKAQSPQHWGTHDHTNSYK